MDILLKYTHAFSLMLQFKGISLANTTLGNGFSMAADSAATLISEVSFSWMMDHKDS